MGEEHRHRESSVITLPQTTKQQSEQLHFLALKIAASFTESEQDIVTLKDLAEANSNLRDERPKINALSVKLNADFNKREHNLSVMDTFLTQSFRGKEKDDVVVHHKNLLNVLFSKQSALKKAFAATQDLYITNLQQMKQQRKQFGFAEHRARRRPKWRTFHAMRNKNEQMMEQTQTQIQTQAQLLVADDTAYNERRAIEAEHVEREITTIAGMLSQLAEMVHGQGQTLGQISNNISDSIENMDSTIFELQKYLAKLDGSQWLMIKIFALLIFFSI